MSEVTTTYKDVEITYDEDTNVWSFELRGKMRDAGSLQAAKKFIDAPVPAGEKPAFERFEAFYVREYGYNGAQRVTVTSIAQPGYKKTPRFWVKTADGKREAVEQAEICPITPENEKLVEEYEMLRKQSNHLSKEAEKRLKAMKRVKVVKPA